MRRSTTPSPSARYSISIIVGWMPPAYTICLRRRTSLPANGWLPGGMHERTKCRDPRAHAGDPAEFAGCSQQGRDGLAAVAGALVDLDGAGAPGRRRDAWVHAALSSDGNGGV